jgi:hypothetical protein
VGELVGQLLHHVGAQAARVVDHDVVAGTHRSLSHGKLAPVMRHKYEFWFKIRLRNMGLDPSLYTLHGSRQAGIQERFLAEGNPAPCKLFT